MPSIADLAISSRNQLACPTDENNLTALKTGHHRELKTRENALFLSTVAQNSSERDIAGRLIAWFRDLQLVSGITDVGPLLDAMEQSRPVVIDELDALFHPLLTRFIIKQFLTGGDRSSAQLLFLTHDTSLLDRRLFRPDQIWFTEKDQCGGTDLYSLVEYEVPEGAVYEEDYIQGRYGARQGPTSVVGGGSV